MTVKNNSLSDRLNEFKNKTSEEDNQELEYTVTDELKDALKKLFNSFVLLIVFLVKALIYGYSINLIFQMNWNIWQFLCIGLSINFLGQYIEKLFIQTFVYLKNKNQ